MGISCTPSAPSSTGTSVKVWKKVNSPKPVKISPPSKRTTKKSVPNPLTLTPKKIWVKNTRKFINEKQQPSFFITLSIFILLCFCFFTLLYYITDDFSRLSFFCFYLLVTFSFSNYYNFLFCLKDE